MNARCWIALAALGAAAPTHGLAGVQVISTAGRNIYRLVSAPGLLAGATYDDRVCAFSADGKPVWEAVAGGFVFDLAGGDLDGDGRPEVIAACANGEVEVFGAGGGSLWKQDLGAPVYQVAIARLDGKTPVVLASGVSREVVAFSAKGERLASAKINGAGRMMRTADFDGDGGDEVAVLPIRGQAQDVCFFQGSGLRKRSETISSGVIPWDPVMRRARDTGENFRQGKKVWNGQSLKRVNGTVADLDGDGVAELIFSPGAYSLKGGVRECFALPEAFKTAGYDSYYNMRLLAAGDLTAEPGAEVVVVEGPAVRLYDARGKELGKAVAPFGFTDVAYVAGAPHGCVILGSSPNGDDNLYRLTFEADWQQALEMLRRHGFMESTGTSLRALGAAAKGWRGTPMQGADGPYDVVVNHHLWSGWDPGKIEDWISEVRDYEKEFPYSRLRFSTAIWPGEKAPLVRPDGKPWGRDKRLAHDLSRDQIVAAAKAFEQASCSFWVQVGHGCDPHLEVATVAAMLDAAPRTLLGFISAEDEQLESVPYYFEHHIRPVLELCLKHHKRFIPRNKDVWWAHWPADPAMRELIFNGRYRSVLVPSVEDSNSRCPEVNLAARVGLWLDGQVDDWASRCCADWFCANRAWEWEYVMTGHPHLRYYLSQAMLGARVFMLLNGERGRLTDGWTQVGTEGAATFLHLLGKGAVTPPRREQLRAISPLALVMEHPSERFKQHGANGHHEEYWGNDGSDSKPWAFDRLDAYWAMAPLPETDVATYLWGRRRRDASHLPVTTPHGLVCLLPGGKPQSKDRWQSLWFTNGDKLWKNGPEYALAEARAAIQAELKDGAAAFPFRLEGQLFHQIVDQGANRFVAMLVDPGWLDPADREVTLQAASPGPWRVADRLTGEKVGDLLKPLSLRVPAGAFRLLEISR